jgi:hypothetical protein
MLFTPHHFWHFHKNSLTNYIFWSGELQLKSKLITWNQRWKLSQPMYVSRIFLNFFLLRN